MSKSTTAVVFFLSIASRIASVVCTKDVSVEWYFLFPLCDVVNRFWDSRYGTNWFKAIRSHTFDKIGSNDIGLLLSGFSWSPCLRIGVTSAVFQISGKVLDVRDVLMMLVIVGAMEGRQHFKTLAVVQCRKCLLRHIRFRNLRER